MARAEVAANRVCIGTCTSPTNILRDVHVGDITEHVAEPEVYGGLVTPNPAPWAETCTPAAYVSSEGLC